MANMQVISALLVSIAVSSSSAFAESMTPAPAPSPLFGNGDPTENVKALVILEARRQDGLREASDKFNAAAIASIKALFDTEIRNTKDVMALRAESDEKLRIAESKRIDAIRAVDVNAVAVASQKADQQANTLAASVTSSAEALRKSQADSAERLANQITTTAATQLQNQQQQFAGVTSLITGLSTRITTLEQSGAEGKGKAGVSDPAYQAMLAEVKKLSDAQTASLGKSEGVSVSVAMMMGIIGLLIAMTGIIVTVLLRRPSGSGGGSSGGTGSVARRGDTIQAPA